jgi:hypothetical protein
MRDKNCTTQHSADEQIGELILRIPAAFHDGLLVKQPHFAELVATEFSVKVEFSYTPGDAGQLHGRFEDAVEPTPAEVTIKAIKADASVHFDGDGVSLTAERNTDLLPLFSHYQIAALEDKLLARAAVGVLE